MPRLTATILLCGVACSRPAPEDDGPALDDLVDVSVTIKQIAGGHQITAGPIYMAAVSRFSANLADMKAPMSHHGSDCGADSRR
jgi:hypothetical protein